MTNSNVLGGQSERVAAIAIPTFDVKQDWPKMLSLGEQQRLAFARLLLNSPRWWFSMKRPVP